MTSSRKLAILAAACATAALIADVLPSQAETPADSLQQLENAYPALQSERRDRDVLPDAARGELELGPEAVYRPNVDGARLMLAKSTARIYLVPAPEHGCVVVVDGGGRQIACANTQAIGSEPLVGATVDGEEYVVQGVAPAGTRDYRVTTDAGESTALDTSSGGFMHQFSAAPRTLSYIDAAGIPQATLLMIPAAPSP